MQKGCNIMSLLRPIFISCRIKLSLGSLTCFDMKSIVRLTLFLSMMLYDLTITLNNYVISNILKMKSSTQRTNSIPTPEELVCMFFKWAAPSDLSSYAVLPYINGISQPLTRLLKKHNIRVVSKPLETLQQEFPSPKSRPPIDLQPNMV